MTAPAAAGDDHGHHEPWYKSIAPVAFGLALLGLGVYIFLNLTGQGISDFGNATSRFYNRNQAWLIPAFGIAGVAGGFFALKAALK